MPTTFVGLLIFIAFLMPGFLYASQRRALVPQAEQSTLMETTSVVSISLATNAVVLALFGLVRWARPKDTPDVGRLLGTGSEYAIEHLPYVLAWGTGLLLISCVLAVTVARSKRVRRRLAKYLRPVIIETSAWCEVFDPPEGSYPYAGVELADGTFVSGTVQWFSTHLEESGDRDLALGPPLQFRSAKGRRREPEVQRVVIAARDIRRLDVTYLETED